MAEFKLGRIRFIWKGDWSVSTTYYKDDIVRNGGNTYVCIEGHTSTNDFTFDSATLWNKITDGQEWKADWAPNVYYKINDIVKYGGYLYICKEAHTSAADFADGLEVELGTDSTSEKWDLFAEGFDYQANWVTGTRYKVNDIVKYNGIIYICTVPHIAASTDASGLEADQDKWDVFSEGFNWLGDWTTGFRYRKNDVVSYGGTIYIANTGHTSAATDSDGLELNQSDWDEVNQSIDYKGDWTATTRYKISDVVKWGGGLWYCVTYHTSQAALSDDEANWAQFVEGLEFEDSWDVATAYQPGDFVTYGGYSYVAKTNHTGSIPTQSPTDWDLFTTGFKFIGDWSDATAYRVGDVVRLGGYSYLSMEDHTNQRPPDETYWQRLNSGIAWRDDVGAGDGSWTDGTYYDLGDAVSYGVNAYICVAEHTADETTIQNRPDQDVTGINWNILSGGVESGNLTTAGDLVYYGGAGPTRLGIGAPGEILKVNDLGNAPEWAPFGAINHVFYVETNGGVDEPAPTYGVTLDRPFKTVRYAAEQVLKGALRPYSTYLLEINKSFIQEETVEWIDAQVVADAGTPFTSAFTYDKAAWRVYFGRIVESLIHDLRQGGNVDVRALTTSIYNAADITGSEAEFNAAVDYLENVTDLVMSNLLIGTDSGTKYSTFTQTVDTNYSEESDATSIINSLLLILTSTVTDQSLAALTAERKPNNTIFVKTGEFSEVLPIIVPENCAVVGDELRSTKITPAGSLVDSGDTVYSLAGIARLQAVISDVVQNTGITKSTSNAETQNTTDHPAGSAAAGTSAAVIIQDLYDYINFKLNAVGTEPTMSGSNDAITETGTTYAVEVIEANRTFLVEEVIGYIADTYPAYVYDEDKCRRDVNRYIDAIKDGLIYNGNYKALLSARYYVNAVNGSITEDMFYMRNGTGLRNCTVSGLTGTLSAANAYGTKRPTAGAFVSLDPGWGPAHTDAWILNKSPYVQNVSTFGTGCVGCKIDGDLHDGGNDSIVSNDFTQILSDGIGVWCTNLGRTELVSVFSYYGHIGYLAENGGKIRATNGNSSYGDFGTVAEGVDATETAITGTVDNRSFDAVVQNVLTDGNEILTFEYLNAGQDYSTSTTAIKTVSVQSGITDENRTEGFYTGVVGSSSGSGTGQTFDIAVSATGTVSIYKVTNGGTGHAVNDDITILASDIGGTGTGFVINVETIGDSTEFVVTGEGFGASVNSPTVNNGAVFEVRLLDTDVDIDGERDFGGAGYESSVNVAQSGDATSITLSNTELALSAAYTGMAIYITLGAGAGQYAYIDNYNAGTKVATVRKMSDGTLGWDHVIGRAIEPVLDDTTSYSIEPRVVFAAPPSGLYSDTAKGRAQVEDEQIVRITIWDPGSGYLSAPTMTIVDPNNTIDVPHTVRIADGVLGQPTWTSRGTGFATAGAEVNGYGFMDRHQPGQYVQVKGLTDIPQPGANLEFGHLTDQYYKLVAVRDTEGTGPYSAQLQISPVTEIFEAPDHNETVELRIRYSQVRLTGHDFLDIGTGNFTNTNYPDRPLIDPDPTKETNDFGGGRVFYTSTDQDGNFRVGELFSIEQATGVATLNADAFNISGLQELQLGEIALGGTGATINEFSTDGTFTANSDNIVPTQKAIKTYIQSQIGGGAGELNVSSLTAGVIQISGQEINTTTGDAIDVQTKMNFESGVDGHPLAMNYFLLS